MKKFLFCFMFSMLLVIVCSCRSNNNFNYYSVKFYDGNICISQDFVKENSLASQPLLDEKAGYNLIGWKNQEGIFWDFDKYLITSDLYLFAIFEEINYDIIYHLDENLIINNKININDPLLIPQKEGYTFEDWYFDKDYSVLYDFNLLVQNSNLYAKWQKNSYKLTLITNNGQPNITTDVVFGSEIDVTAPFLEGGLFDGWYLDSDFNQINQYTLMPAHDLILYANFINIFDKNTFKITFNLNNGNGIDVLYFKSLQTIIYPDEPILYGYHFLGWYKDSQLTEPNDYLTMPEHDITLYAKWDEIKYEVNFIDGETILYKINAVLGENIIFPDNPQKTGYKFLGWYDENNIKYNYIVMPSRNINLYAKWQTEFFSVSYYSDNIKIDEKILKYGDEIIIPDEPQREGYEFIHWCSDQKLQNQYIFTTMPAKNFNLYAKWEKLYYIIEFDSDGGSQIQDLQVYFNDNIVLPKNPVKDNYYFSHWIYADGTRFEASLMPAHNIKLFAVWVQNVFSVSFYYGDNNFETITAAINSKIDLPYIIYKDDYVFSYWCDSPSLTNECENTQIITSDMKFYAKWTKADAYFNLTETIQGYSLSLKLGIDIADLLVIPKTINGKSVIKIENFSQADFIHVVIPQTVNSIDLSAFENCKNLKTIEILSSVLQIDALAFYNCVSLTSVILNEGLTKIGEGAFYNCISLASIILPGTINKIEARAFNNCSALKSVVFTSAIPEHLADNAFETDYGLIIYVPGDSFDEYLKHFVDYTVKKMP